MADINFPRTIAPNPIQQAIHQHADPLAAAIEQRVDQNAQAQFEAMREPDPRLDDLRIGVLARLDALGALREPDPRLDDLRIGVLARLNALDALREPDPRLVALEHLREPRNT